MNAVRWKDIYDWFLESLTEAAGTKSGNLETCVINIGRLENFSGDGNILKRWYLDHMPVIDRDIRLVTYQCS